MERTISVSDRGQREDAFLWAVKVASAGVPVSGVLADAAAIHDYMGGRLAPVEVAITTIQRFRDRLPNQAQIVEPHDVGSLHEFFGNLIRDLQEPLIDAEIVDEEPKRPEWAEVSEFTDVVSERDRARDLAVRLEQELAQIETRFAAAEHEIDRRGDKADRLEQENAELTRANAELEGTLNQVGLVSARTQKALLEATQELEEARGHLVRGVLSAALRIAQSNPERSGIRVVQLAAEKFGVSL